MNRKALAGGLTAGMFVLVVAVLWLPWVGAGITRDLFTHGLAVIVAAVAAATSAALAGAGVRRVGGRAGLALVLTLVVAWLLDYAWTVAVFTSGLPGVSHGQGTVTGEEVADAVESWVLARNVVACALGLVGGSILGARGALASHVRAGK